jgi:hypothetical protein
MTTNKRKPKKPAPLTRSQRIDAAMSQATLDAMEEGISDSDEILKRKLAARARVKAEMAEEEALATAGEG